MLESIEADEIREHCARFGGKVLNQKMKPLKEKVKKLIIAKYTIETQADLKKRGQFRAPNSTRRWEEQSEDNKKIQTLWHSRSHVCDEVKTG